MQLNKENNIFILQIHYLLLTLKCKKVAKTYAYILFIKLKLLLFFPKDIKAKNHLYNVSRIHMLHNVTAVKMLVL